MSNDLKYVLLPTIDDRRRPPKFQPWYRERIRMKYPSNINTKNWKFVKDGLDDFRDGLPPCHDDIMLQPEKGLGPVLLAEPRRVKSCVVNAQSRLSAHQKYYSREIPAAEKRRRTIDHYISSLLEHPVAFFEHFSKVLTPETYDRVTRLFEAELLRYDAEDPVPSVDGQNDTFLSSGMEGLTQAETVESDKSGFEHASQETEKIGISELSNDLATKARIDSSKQLPELSENKPNPPRITRNGVVYDDAGNQWNAEEYDRKQRNPYRWYIEKQRQKQRAKGPSQDEQAATAMETKLRHVSEQFCAWLYDLGGETNTDIDPAVVRNLFSTAYDTKPSLSVPIKVVEMTRIPVDLRDGTQDTMIAEPQQPTGTLSEMRMGSGSAKAKEITTALINQRPHTQKYRYGAWYLPKTLWHRKLTTEELIDPKATRAEREDTSRKREEEINSRLAPLHGVNAFRDYLLETNATRMPKLISDVEQYRRNHLTEGQMNRTGLYAS
ncbi:unnamed protein product [Adineta ricciae]|uniref:Uncharacterized protein n=1 Tax=Adineta ricciae TaxID=249248 RepID=A0A814H695_ADIRI|nr:unnamed protein product [Adineta ricciae]CAF1006427.1 unnamed protein product [Adineta ricciae]